MTDGPWWGSDPEEQPIPLVPLGQASDQPLGMIADEAERIVLASRDAIAREDTEPTLQYRFPARAPRASRLAWGAKPADRAALTLLILSCVASFMVGWM